MLLAFGKPATRYSPSGDTLILLPKSMSVILNKLSLTYVISWSNIKFDCSLVLL